MRIPVELLVALCLAVGLLPAVTVGPLLAVAAQAALAGGPYAPLPEYELAIWHGFNLPLLMSAIALAGGVLLYFGLQKFVDLHRLIHWPRGGREVFAFLIERVVRAADALTTALVNGSLQRYLLLLVLLALAAGSGPPLAAWVGGAPPARLPAIEGGTPFVFVAMWAIGIAAAFGTVLAHRARLLALILLGAVGLVVSLTFVYLSAPDLALTQLLVEVATIILLMLALNWLPPAGARERGRARRVRDAAIAAVVGAGVAAIVWTVLERPVDSIAPYFLERAAPEGGGTNVVNVILVDFRGFDTLGEITVLGVAGLTIYALLRDFVPRTGALAHAPADDSEATRHPLMLVLVARLLLPFAVLVAVYLFLRGHNLPGGGFIAGLVLAIALILQFVANGQSWVEQRMRVDFRAWIASGLLIAGLTGVGSWFFGSPFLTSTYDYPQLPLLGRVPLASAALFDLGVLLTVVGATMTGLLAMARLTLPAATAGGTKRPE
jgi:multicomponent K+:H+ antiporter subunit A